MATLTFGAPAPTPTANAPSTGFSFTAANAPTGAAAPTPAAATPVPAFGSTPAQPAPQPASAANNNNNATPQQQQQHQQPPTSSLVVPEFDSIFPNLHIQDRIERHLSKVSLNTDEGRWEQQLLLSLLQCNPSEDDASCGGHVLANPKALPWKAANPAIRNQLQTNPVVSFARTPEKQASLTPAILQEVWSLADDLRVSEAEALVLYAQASKLETRQWLLEEEMAGNLVVLSEDADEDGDRRRHQQGSDLTVPQAARQLYFCECHAMLHTLLSLIQKRIEASQQLDTWGANYLHATDALLQSQLVPHLIALTRDFTQQEFDLQRDIKDATNAASASVPFMSPLAATPAKKIRLFQKVLLEFVQRERQVAAECLFFLTYHTQCTADEVVALIDLVKDLTNQGLPGVDPFDDKLIPNPHQEAPVHQWQAPLWAPIPPPPPPPTLSQPAKDPLLWQRELVNNICKTGQPQLLQCVAVLVMAGICALDAQHELMDRHLHGPNVFGVGNALLPPGTTDTCGLTSLHSRLTRAANNDWVNRKDVFGIFSASYAILLRSVPTILSSPRVGPTASPNQVDFKTAWRDCLEAPTELMSFTFARLTLLPALRRWTRPQPVSTCRPEEFLFETLADWTSRYLEVLCSSGEVPISRAQWEKEQEDELALLRAQQEQQRQFRTWQGFPTSRQDDEQFIPTHVDRLKRPDCMDDVIALAVAVCSTGSASASSFWAVEERQAEEVADAVPILRLAPASFLRNLKGLLPQDRSLLPSYLSFLAALALVGSPHTKETGAAVVHRLLSPNPDTDNNGSFSVNWRSLMDTLRWYARELSPQDYSLKAPPTSSTASSSFSATGGSTAYYYGADNTSGSTSGGTSAQDGGTSGSNASKPKELGEANTFLLLSHLAVISNVASHFPEARNAVLGIKLPVEGSDDGREDTALTILFSLSIVPLTPEVRGTVFTTIANLLRIDSISDEEQAKQIRELARIGWNLLEDCQVIPIALLDQYALPPDGSQRMASNVTFPPSSISMVGEGNTKAWTPNDSTYGILFEMEHVESHMGWYPSTEGFLKLLASLVSSTGCPCDLGSSKRVRPGCSPYIEYVARFVIPRVAGGQGSSIPFRMTVDKNRLLARALEVVEAVLVRYVVPPKKKSTQEWINEHRSRVHGASTKLGITILAEQVVIHPTLKDAEMFEYDFRNSSVGEVSTAVFGPIIPRQAIGYDATGIGSPVPVIPFPKTPGFALLADILSAQGGSVFRAVTGSLAEHLSKRERGGDALDEIEAGKHACAFGLLGALIPNVSSAKTITKGSLYARQNLLKPIIPSVEDSCLDGVGVDDPAKWREQATIHALRILCAVAVREEMFLDAVNSAPGARNFAPVIKFHERPSSGALESLAVQPALLKDILILDMGANGTVRSIAELIDYCASSEIQEADIAAPAIAFIFYLHKLLLPDESDRLLHSQTGRDILPEAVAKRLLVSAARPNSSTDAQVVRLVLDWIVDGLREPMVSSKSISHRLLGLPTVTGKGTWLPGSRPSPLRPRDCLDAMIQILRDIHFITRPKSAFEAAKCFEIVARLCDGGNVAGFSDMQSILICAERLRSAEFWKFHVIALLATGDTNPSILNCITCLHPSEDVEGAADALHSSAWLLKGVANELRLLEGVEKYVVDMDVYDRDLRWLLAPRPEVCKELLSTLFSPRSAILKGVLECIPLENSLHKVVEPVLTAKDAVEGATVSLSGPHDVISGYKRIDNAKLLLTLKPTSDAEKLAVVNWVDQWNSQAAWDCAASHLSDALRIALGSSLESSSWLTRDYALLLSNYTNDASALSSADLVEILNLILARLTYEEPNGQLDFGMDDNIFSMASLHLSQAALALAERLGAEKRLGNQSLATFTDSDFLDLCSSFARAIVLSSSSSGGIYTFSRREERTVILGSALAAMLGSTRWLEIPNRIRELLLHAGVALARLSGNKVNSGLVRDGQGGVHPAAVIAARTCLATIVDLFSKHDDGAPREQSFNFAILTALTDTNGSKFSQLLVDLIAVLDDRASTLMVAFIRSPFGADLLLEGGLGKALSTAADNYASQEAQALQQRGTPLRSFGSVDIATPTFLGEHLQVLKALLSTPYLSQHHCKALVDDVSKILNGHRALIERLFVKFPMDNDVLLKCFECVALTEGLSKSNPTMSATRNNLSVAIQSGPFIGFLELSIFDLTFHLLENPFPRQLLPQLPQALTAAETVENTHMTPVLRQERTSWWEKIAFSNLAGGEEGHVLPSPPTGGLNFQNHPGTNIVWTEAKFDFSIRGLEIAVSGLSILIQKATHEKFPFTSDLAVARILCQVAAAARTIEGRVRMLDQLSRPETMDTSDSTDFLKGLERKYLRSLGTKLGRCAELLLVVALSRVRAIKSSNVQANVSEAPVAKANTEFRLFAKAVLVSIEYNAIDDMGIGCVVWEGGESRREFAKKLTKAFRNEMEFK